MRWARFEHEGAAGYGIVEDDAVEAVEGSDTGNASSMRRAYRGTRTAGSPVHASAPPSERIGAHSFGRLSAAVKTTRFPAPGPMEDFRQMPNQHDAPPVSVIIPARDAEATIAKTLESILAQDYAGPVEVIVADGSDGPATAETIRRVAPATRIIPNPERIVPTGLNAALRAATAPIVMRCDVRAVLPPDYVRRAVATLRRTGAANVGGRQVPVGTSWFTRTVAMAQTTWLGTGGVRYRQGGAEGPADTVYLGTFRREALTAVGGFNTTIPVSEDYELNWRLQQRGEVVWFDPALAAFYRPRQNLRDLARQYFNYGGGKRTVLRRHPRSLRLRQIAAPLLVFGLAASAGLAAVGATGAAMVVPAAWLGVLVGGAIGVGVRRHDAAVVLLPLVLATMHLSWGAGFLMARTPLRAQGGSDAGVRRVRHDE